MLFVGGTLQYSAANQVDYSGEFSQTGGQQWQIDPNGQVVLYTSQLTDTGGSGGSSNPTSSMTVTGSNGGVLVLAPTAPSTYRGVTTLAGNITLEAGAAQPFGTDAVPGGMLFTGGTLEYSPVNHVDYSGWFSPNGGQSWAINPNGQTVTYQTPLQGNSSLTLGGTDGGTLILAPSTTAASYPSNYSGGTTIWSDVLKLGDSSALGSGSLTVDGGTLDMAGYGSTVTALSGLGGKITNSGTAQSVLTVNQSPLTTFSGALTDGASASLALVKTATGSLTLAGSSNYSGGTTVGNGTLRVSGAGNFGAAGGALTVTGGLVDLNSTNQGIGNLSGTGGSIANNGSAQATLTIGNGNATGGNFSGVIGNNTTGGGGTLALTKVGSGMITLGGANSYSGPTAVNQGELLVNGSLTGSLVTVNSGGVLGGTGSLTSVTVNAGGQLAPGDSPGILDLSSSLDLEPGARMDYELEGVSSSDEVLMPTGELVLNDQQFSDFNFTALAGFSPGSIYTLIEAGSISGSLGANTRGTIDGHAANLAIQGNDLVLTVPEPSTVTLLGVAAIGLFGGAWRRRKSRLSA